MSTFATTIIMVSVFFTACMSFAAVCWLGVIASRLSDISNPTEDEDR